MRKYLGGTVALAALTAILLAACNSGGDGDKKATTGSLSVSEAASSARLAAKAASTLSKLMPAPSGRKFARASTIHSKNITAVVAPDSTPINCGVSGTYSSSTSTDGITTETYAECVDNVNYGAPPVQATEYRNGTTSFSSSINVIHETRGAANLPFTDRYTSIASGKLLQESIDNYTAIGTISGEFTCSGTYSMAVTLNGTSVFKVDEDTNGTLDQDGSATFTSLALESSTVNDTGCNQTSSSMKFIGTIAVVDNLNAENSITMTSTASNPFSETDTFTKDRISSVISGTVTVASKCANGTLTYTTVQPIVVVGYDTCPISGMITLTGDVNTTVTFNSDGSVDVGGTHFKSCNDAKVCS